MSSRYAVEAQGVGKKYIINHQAQVDTLRELLTNKLKRATSRLFKTSNQTTSDDADKTTHLHSKLESEEFWALSDVSFAIEPGDRVGIFGRNGAGKSTLLKVLSRITTPTTGTIITRGKITSLLEVGTGFHPDLTGRENVFLNGSIMGMSRKEIKSKFDQIVDFSEVEKFLDTPVKHYSSGMQMRLAFSVAAHLTPDILILDEVLSVGDHKFQQKSLKRMEEINNSGCTVIFVSHSIDAIQKYCKRAILLSDGKIAMDSYDMELALDLYTKM